jgi:transposase
VPSSPSCTKCDCIEQTEVPSVRSSAASAGPGVLANGVYAAGSRVSTLGLADGVGGACQLLNPLEEALGRYLKAARKLHADDTPVPVLVPGQGKTKTGRLGTYGHRSGAAG